MKKESKKDILQAIADQAGSEVRQVPGYPQYALTTSGRLFEIARKMEVDIFIGRTGYRQAWLYRGKRKLRHPKMIYRLMAATFLPPRPSDKHLVRHLDGDCHNDSAANLAWGTHADNMEDLRKHRLQRASLTKALKSEILKVVKKNGDTVEKRKQIAEDFNVSFTTVNRIYWTLEDAKKSRKNAKKRSRKR